MRLGLSQQAVAEIGGVSKNTQYLNEQACRAIDPGYYDRLAAHGFEVGYILTGHRNSEIPAQLQPVVGSLVNLWLSCTLDDETIDSWAKMFDRWNPFLNPDAKVFPTRRVERPLDAPKGDADDLTFLRGNKS